MLERLTHPPQALLQLSRPSAHIFSKNIKTSRNITVAYCDYSTDAGPIGLSEAETEANPRLIAAAPELLEAL
jgi:hypothetical protein